MKIVVLGGYGNFGARICRALAKDDGIEVIVAGRDAGRAAAFAREIGAAHAAIDAASPDLSAALATVGAEAVVHTAGPFQGQAYGVAQAVARAGCHYIDLADGRRFVADFGPALHDAFRAAGRCAVAGASTVPALSCAVIDEYLPRFARLRQIDLCIAPAQQAPRGEATLAGVLSYCGEPIDVWRGGRWQRMHGWSAPSRVTFAHMPPRRGALCDIPDLELLPARYPGVQDVMFRAALEVGASQWVFAALAWLRRHRLVGPPAAWAPLLHRVGGLFDALGTPTGGMAVRLRGEGTDGRPLALAWHITAPDNHGPEIPCMAAILLARRLARGAAWAPGAQACMGLLPLADFAPLFQGWGMRTDLVDESA